MNSINLNKTPLKIAIVGPQKVGKTVIANSLSEFSHVVSPDYHPTMGCRILEMEKTFSDEQVKNIPILKNNKINKIKIELWDVSGDKKFSSTWPAIKYGAHGVIIVVDAMSIRYDNALDEWLNGFCKDYNRENITCFSYKKDDAKKGDPRPKKCNQYPALPIAEVKNDMSTLLPNFNKFVSKILLSMQ